MRQTDPLIASSRERYSPLLTELPASRTAGSARMGLPNGLYPCDRHVMRLAAGVMSA
jgi:hypothetical protein